MASDLIISDEGIAAAKEILDSAMEFGIVDENGKKIWLDRPLIGLLCQANGSEYPVYLAEHASHFSLNIMKLDKHFIGEQARISEISIGGTVINAKANLYQALKDYNKAHDFENENNWSHDQVVVLCYNRGKFEAVYPA